MGFTYALFVTNQAVVSYTAIPPLPLSNGKKAVYFCCTFLRVASTRRYLASCPMKPGLSSPAAFRLCSRDHPSYSPHKYISFYISFVNYKLYFETASTDKFPYNRISRNRITAYAYKIIHKFNETLRFRMIRTGNRNTEKKWFTILF